jgi:hypothetical protein
MSKQSEAKLAQGYEPKPVPKTCVNCAHYRSDISFFKSAYSSKDIRQEKDIRCGIGGFSVNKMATCSQFKEM